MKKRTKKEIRRCLTGIVTASLIISNVHIGTFALAAKKTSIAKSAKVTVGKTVRVKLKNNKKSVKWKVSKGTKYVKITKKSKTGCTVKGLKKGSATVQAVIGKKKYSCKITVAAKKTTKKPATTKKPVTTRKPVATAKPTATTKPTASSDVTVKPFVTETPKVTNTPSATSAPTVTETPTVAPVVTAAPTVAPTKKTEPEVTLVPTTTPTKTPDYDDDDDDYDDDDAEPTSKPGELKTFRYYGDDTSSFQNYKKPYNVIVDDEVTKLSEEAFEGCTNMVSITIPKSVKSIGVGLFYKCDNLSKITVDADNPYFDSRDDCNAIVKTDSNAIVAGCKSTVFKDSVTEIFTKAFYGTGIEEVILPDNITSIGKSAFSECGELTKISIPGDTGIRSEAFSGCDKLSDIEIGEGNGSWEFDIFAFCGSLEKINIPKGRTLIPSYSFYGCSSLKEIVISEDVATIASYAFAETGLTELNIPDTLTKIQSYAFQGCASLTKINLSSSVKFDKYTTDIFSGCTSLEEVTIPTGITYIAPGMFSGCEKLKDVTIEGENASIGGNAFYGCKNLKAFKFPKGALGAGTFSGCTGLEKIDLTGVTSIGEGCFSYCSNLSEVTLSGALKTIGMEAFSECEKLAEITIPEGVENIRSYAFGHCVLLKKVHIPASVKQMGTGVFIEDPLEEITVDENNEYFYCGEGVNAIISKQNIGSGKRSIETHDAYELIAGCKNTVIPDGVKKIADYAFYHADIENINIPSGITEIGDTAFEGCAVLKEINIPDTVSKIGIRTFAGCDALEKITVDAANEYYYSDGSNAIITKQEIPHESLFDFSNRYDSNQPYELVYGCKTTVIPDSAKIIGFMAFTDLKTLTKLTIPDDIKVNDIVFWNCDNLKSITWKGTEYKSITEFYKANNPGLFDDDDDDIE